MNNTQTTATDTKLLILGVLSFLFWPFTAVPEIVIGRQQPPLSSCFWASLSFKG